MYLCGIESNAWCKNRVKKPKQLLCLSSSSKQGVGEMDVLEFMCLAILRHFSCARDCTTTLIPEYLALATGKLGSVRMVTTRRWGNTGRYFAQSCFQSGFGPNILQDQQLLDFWVTLSSSTPMFPSDLSTCLSRVHFGYSSTQATTEFLNYRNNPVQPLKLVLLQFNLYFKNKIKSILSISCTNDFPRKLILKLIHWLVLCRKKMLKSLNT